MSRYLVPLFAFIILVIFLGIGLTKDPRVLPSPFIGKSAPDFSLPLLHKPDIIFEPSSMRGKVWILNVWASWCVSCRAEHQVLNELIKNRNINLVGLNYKDDVTDARRWLKQFGDPYQLSISDIEGRAGIDWGVYGVPETFVMDKQGIVRFKHTGPVTGKVVLEEILPLLNILEQQS